MRYAALLPLHSGLNLFRSVCQLLSKINQFALSVDVEGVFEADADLLLRNVEARFDGENGPDSEGFVVVVGIVHINADGVPESMQEVFSQRIAVQVFAVRIDVIK